MTCQNDLLILAPRGRDAHAIQLQLASGGIRASVASASEIVAAVTTGSLGAAVVAEEAMSLFDIGGLSAALEEQPPWSDCPFLLLTSPNSLQSAKDAAMALLGNAIKMERPLSPGSFISSVRSALRARARQRAAEIYLREREEAEAQVRELATTLEQRVLDRTRALSKALAERSQAEDRLAESHELYRYTVELSNLIPWTADADGVLLSVGAAWLHRTGRETTGALGHGWLESLHPEDRDGAFAAWKEALETTSPFLCDYRLVKAGGSYGWCRARAAPRVADGRRVLRWYGTIEDIDERHASLLEMQQLQSDLIRVSRLSGMGTMASSIAHELNQPLTAIANYVRGSRRLLPKHGEFDQIRKALNAADACAVRAGEIVRRVRQLIADGDVSRKPCWLADIVNDACGLAMIDARASGIKYRIEVDPRIGEVLVDRVQIQQVLFNLLRNATEALSRSPVREIMVAAVCRSNDACEVTVRDTGPGISPQGQARLFQPFNTTKNDGMGIGLSISRTIIEAHGGEIWHVSPPGGGALFGFTLMTPGGPQDVPLASG